MIDLIKAEKAFKEYLKDYNTDEEAIKLKMIHTYGVVNYSKILAERLNLSEEDRLLSNLIALLHDIGRFEQSKVIDGVFDKADALHFDHAVYGAKVLFEDGLIRKFIEEDTYDAIIEKAILNHNKFALNEEGLTEREVLHCKLIRDNDKMDNFRVKSTESFKILLGTDDIDFIENEIISDEAYEQYISKKQIITTTTKTCLDRWISYVAFIFDINFKESLEILIEDDMINKVLERINYRNPDTIETMIDIRNVTNEYLQERLK